MLSGSGVRKNVGKIQSCLMLLSGLMVYRLIYGGSAS